MLAAASAATVVPHEPPPITATFIVTSHSVRRDADARLYDASVNGRQRHAVLVPVKAFADAKARLSAVLAPDQRNALARWTADRVVAAAGELPVYVACDDDEVAKWAVDRGAIVLWHPGAGLNGAVSRSVAQLAQEGATHVVVAHGDLPLAHDLAGLIVPGAVTLVPDAHRDGTNVVAVPSELGFAFSYGPNSFQRHLALALASGRSTIVKFEGNYHGDWRGKRHADGERIDDCTTFENTRRLHQIRDTVIRIHDPVGGGSGWGNWQPIIIGDHRRSGLKAADSFW